MEQTNTSNNLSQNHLQALITFGKDGKPLAFRILADSAEGEALVTQSLDKMLRPYRNCLPPWVRRLLP